METPRALSGPGKENMKRQLNREKYIRGTEQEEKAAFRKPQLVWQGLKEAAATLHGEQATCKLVEGETTQQ